MPGWLVKWWMATRRYRHNATMDWLCRCQTSHEQTQQFPQVLNHLHIFTYCLYVKKIQKSSNIIKNPQFKKQLNTSKLFPFALFSSPKRSQPWALRYPAVVKAPSSGNAGRKSQPSCTKHEGCSQTAQEKGLSWCDMKMMVLWLVNNG